MVKSKNTRSLYSVARAVFSIGWPFLVLAVICSALFVHIAASPTWRDVYLYNGDSVTLALIAKSIQSGEALNWTLSSQLFFFPEGLIYGIGYLFTQSPHVAFIVNSIANIGILFLLFFWIIRQFFDKRVVAQFLALLFVSIISLYSLLEKDASINQSSIATLFLFNTYYYGVILTSLALIALTMKIIKNESAKLTSKKLLIPIAVYLTLLILTQISNPLLLLQFNLPLLVTIGFLFLINKIPLRVFLLLGGVQVIGIIAAQILRIPFKPLVGTSTESYIKIENIPSAIEWIGETARIISLSKSSALEFGIIVTLAIFALFYAVYFVFRTTRDKSFVKNTGVLIISLFSGIASPLLILATITTGSSYTRYYLPLIVFPLLSIVVLLYQHKIRISTKFIYYITGLIVFFFGAYCLYKLPKTQPLELTPTDSVTCYANYAQNHTVSAVAGFWTARPLDLYGSGKDDRVLQVNPALNKLDWMNNFAAYDNQTFDTVIVDRQPMGPANISTEYVAFLGEPASIIDCPSYMLYKYDRASQGYELLNKTVQTRAIRER